MTNEHSLLNSDYMADQTWVGMAWSNIGPTVTLALTCLLALQSAGSAAFAAMTAGLLPTLALHYWGVRRPRSIPVLVAFLAGVWVDVLAHGPLGFWALTYVATALTVDALTPILPRGLLGHTASLVLTLALVACLLWGMSSVYNWQLLPITPIGTAAVWALALYAMTALVCAAMSAMVRLWTGRRVPRKRWISP
jgi:cell shape-determining protein MreD